MRIYLLGFMGSGKTFLGNKLAKQLNYKFIDTDDIIEEQAGETITEIFDKFGESTFREFERNALLNISDKSEVVVATGGGMPCFSDNMEIIKNTGISIYLKMSPQSLVKRLENIKDSRPLLKTKSNEELYEFINKTLKKREPYYIKATYTINGENATVYDLLPLLPKS